MPAEIPLLRSLFIFALSLVAAHAGAQAPAARAPDPIALLAGAKAASGGTEVRMVHSNVPAEQADSYRQGWVDFYWNPLKAYFSK